MPPVPFSKLLRPRLRKRGFSMSDVMLGIVIVLVATAVLYTAFTQVNRMEKKRQSNQLLSMVMADIREWRNHTGSYATLDTATVIRLGVLPPGWFEGEDFIVIPYGGEMRVQGNPDGSDSFVADISWSASGFDQRAFCTYLASNDSLPGQFSSGALGASYYVDPGMLDCDAAHPSFRAVFSR